MTAIQYQAILFDLDGTLVDSARDIASVLTHIRAERGGDTVPPEQVRSLIGLGVEQLIKTTLGPFITNVPDDIALFRAELLRIPPNADILFGGVENALRHLRDTGHKLAVVSNKPEALCRTLLENLELSDLFGAIVGGDTAAYAKPHPAPIFHALSAIGARSSQALFVGDSSVDRAVAHAAGLPFILYAGGYGQADMLDPPRTVASFSHFVDLSATIAAVDCNRTERHTSV